MAQLKATIWKEDFIRINERFQSVLKEPLKSGIKILFCARITFDPGYGLSLHILEIDPAYTLGELEKEKGETINRLIQEGIFDKNKKIPFPLLPQRIAIISVETSKGYADFIQMLHENQWGYHFFYMLFPALLQGEKAVPAIRHQLMQIKRVMHHFDVVAIIRGGGGDVGLSCYNNYLLTKDIANFPLPVLTGIGHATNETVSEMVACTNSITPTALASFLIQTFHNFAVPLHKAELLVLGTATKVMEQQKEKFTRITKDFSHATWHLLVKGKHYIQSITSAMAQQVRYNCLKEKEKTEFISTRIKTGCIYMKLQQEQVLKTNFAQLKKQIETGFITQHQSLNNLERIAAHLNPLRVLQRGYTITKINGKGISSIKIAKSGDLVETVLTDGTMWSKFEKKQKTK